MKKQNEIFIIAGPCVVESFEMLNETAQVLSKVCNKYELKLYFKSSYKKANRTSYDSFTGIGDKKALEYLQRIGEEFSVPVLTDVHTVEEARLAANYVDVLQIPAFLSRQTDLLVAAAQTGKIVNIKKGQFMAPDDMKKAALKVTSTGNKNCWLTERGVSFGYHDLVVDFRSLLIMREYGFPVVYDATHSLQKPSIGEQSGGTSEYVIPLARAAVALGIDGLFFETHPDPKKAKSDAATQLPLDQAEKLIKGVKTINDLIY
jgi:2-dehydro-3-deoxyphosphooctonate aldolase (KDO 8-P synthase)